LFTFFCEIIPANLKFNLTNQLNFSKHQVKVQRIMSENFGIDLIFETQRGNIQSENDVLMIVVHWILCKNEFRNVGIGDNRVFSDEDRPTELLPQGWNQVQTNYALRYVLNKTNQIYILHGIVSDNDLLVNFLDAKTLKTATVLLKTKEIVRSKTGTTLDSYVPDAQSIIDQITKDVIKPLIEPPATENPRTSQSTNTDPDSRIGPLYRPPGYTNPSFFDPLRHDPLRDIGRGDLDPFGRGGGSIFRPDLRHQPGPFNPLAPGG
jgi:proteasome inhibitor subunit 1 (PI31)